MSTQGDAVLSNWIYSYNTPPGAVNVAPPSGVGGRARADAAGFSPPLTPPHRAAAGGKGNRRACASLDADRSKRTSSRKNRVEGVP